MFRFSHFEVGIGLERGGGIFWKSTRAEREASCQNLPVGDGDNHLMLLKPDMDMGKLVLLVVHIQHRQIPFACSKALNGTAFDAAGIWQRDKPRRGKPGSIRMVIAWEAHTQYRGGRFPMCRIVEKVVRRRFAGRFQTTLQNALRTAQ